MIRLVIPETKRTTTVEELSALVKSHKNEDVITRLGDIKLENNRLIVGDSAYAVRENGMKGLLSHLHMPFGYASSIPSDLLYDSVNRLCKTYGDAEVLVRAQDGEVRGVLSPTYVPLDTNVLVDRLGDAQALGLMPARLSYDGDSLTVSMVTTAEVRAKEVGDISKVGVSLETSDIGCYPLSSGAYLHRMVCTNGAVLPVQFGGGVSFSQKKVNPDTVWALFDEGYARILDKMSKVDSEFLIRLGNKKVDAAGFVKARNTLSQAAGGRRIATILNGMEQELLEKGTDYTFYDIYNMVTSSARDEASLYVAQELEKAAGELLFSFGTEASKS
jgi:hypothetical protein